MMNEVRVDASVKVDIEELHTWPRENVKAFMEGIAKVLSAGKQQPPPATAEGGEE